MAQYRIKANRNQLATIGIDANISGFIGELKHVYPTGWYEIEVTYTDEYFSTKIPFCIPKTFLEEVKNGNK